MYDRFQVDRVEEINAIKELIENRHYYKENSLEGISILLNGSWGSGKTTFIKQLCDDSELKEKYKIIKYDSFEYDFYDNPYTPLFSFLYDNLKVFIDVDKLTTITSKKISKVLLNTVYDIINSLLKLKTGKDLDDLKNELKQIKEDLAKESNAYNEFKNLEKIKNDIKTTLKREAEKTPIIFVVDELDRCNPNFAVGTLEILKYFLDIENFIVILSLDEKQLQESVKTIYGLGMNSDAYFSKFFDYKFNLRHLTFSEILDCSSITNMPDILQSIDHIFDILDVSVRDSHKIFIEFLRKYKMHNKNDDGWTKQQSLFILFMITIKNIDLMFYNSIINSNFQNFRKIIEQGDNVDKKKYLKVLNYSLSGESDINTCLTKLTINFYEKYIDVKYLYYVEVFGDSKFKNDMAILKNMNPFIPQVLVDKTYGDNLLEILN